MGGRRHRSDSRSSGRGRHRHKKNAGRGGLIGPWAADGADASADLGDYFDLNLADGQTPEVLLSADREGDDLHVAATALATPPPPRPPQPPPPQEPAPEKQPKRLPQPASLRQPTSPRRLSSPSSSPRAARAGAPSDTPSSHSHTGGRSRGWGLLRRPLAAVTAMEGRRVPKLRYQSQAAPKGLEALTNLAALHQQLTSPKKDDGAKDQSASAAWWVNDPRTRSKISLPGKKKRKKGRKPIKIPTSKPRSSPSVSPAQLLSPRYARVRYSPTAPSSKRSPRRVCRGGWLTYRCVGDRAARLVGEALHGRPRSVAALLSDAAEELLPGHWEGDARRWAEASSAPQTAEPLGTPVASAPQSPGRSDARARWKGPPKMSTLALHVQRMKARLSALNAERRALGFDLPSGWAAVKNSKGSPCATPPPGLWRRRLFAGKAAEEQRLDGDIPTAPQSPAAGVAEAPGTAGRGKPPWCVHTGASPLAGLHPLDPVHRALVEERLRVLDSGGEATKIEAALLRHDWAHLRSLHHARSAKRTRSRMRTVLQIAKECCVDLNRPTTLEISVAAFVSALAAAAVCSVSEEPEPESAHGAPLITPELAPAPPRQKKRGRADVTRWIRR